MTDLPEYYFRVRENGAIVFRIDTENRMRRIEMDQIAVVNVKNGEIKPHGDRARDGRRGGGRGQGQSGLLLRSGGQFRQ